MTLPQIKTLGEVNKHAQSLNDIKHEAGHDMNRMAQMIADLRNALTENQQLTTSIQNQLADEKQAAINLSADRDETKTSLSLANEQILQRGRIIENQEEHIRELFEDLAKTKSDLSSQLRITSDIALQVSIARRDEAMAEKSHRETIQIFAREREEIHRGLTDLDKLKRLLAQRSKECQTLMQENNYLAERADAKIVWRQARRFLTPKWLQPDLT